MVRSTLIGLAWLAAACAQASDDGAGAAPAGPGGGMTAVAGRPAVVTPQGDVAGCRAAYLTVSVVSFQPSPGGPVNLVVTLLPADGPPRVLGQPGIFPHAAFSRSDRPKRFGFQVDPQLLRNGARVSVALAPADDAQGARAEVGAVTVGPLPGERC